MKKALIIGINDYPKAPLKCCINDATAIEELLSTNGDGSPNFAVQLVTSVKTKRDLKERIVKLFEGDDETVLLYFAGHGLVNEIGGYIVTPDFEQYDEGINMEEILTIISKSEIRNKIVILDCCHSGAFGAPEISQGSSHLDEGVSILTASRNNQLASEVNGHGVFTNLLIEALKGGAADLRGHITPGSVYAYIDQALGAWEQRPVFKTNISRFISLRNIMPPVPLDILRKMTEYFPSQTDEYKLVPSHEYTNEIVAKADHVAIFKNLQKYQSVGLLKPVGEEYMYWAAQNSKSCKLTPLGYHYWRLVKEKLI